MYNVGHLKAPYLWPPSVVCPPQPMAMFSSSLSTHLKLPTLFTQLSEAASGFLRFRSWILEVESGIGTKPEKIKVLTSFQFLFDKTLYTIIYKLNDGVTFSTNY